MKTFRDAQTDEINEKIWEKISIRNTGNIARKESIESTDYRENTELNSAVELTKF